MKNLKNFLQILILASGVTALVAGCQEKGDDTAKAVLASVESLDFPAENPQPQLITVYSDAQWTAEVPEWVTIDPATGSGTTDVTVSVTENMVDGAMDNPRSAELVFKGSTHASRAVVVINQDGDEYKGAKDYTVTEAEAVESGTVVIIPEAQVAALTAKGFIISDGTGSIYVEHDPSTVAVGTKVSLSGTVTRSSGLPAIMSCDQFEAGAAGEFTYPAATDITSSVDTYTSDKRTYVSVTGVLQGTTVTVEGAAKISVAIIDIPASTDLAPYNGHEIEVKGYFAGVATPYLNLMMTEFEDKGSREIIYFSDDFEWLQPWATQGDNEGKPAGKTVEENNLDAYCPQLPTSKIDGKSTLDALEEAGYEFLRVWADGKNESECIYLQMNYLKFGKTGYQAGITLPVLDVIPEQGAGVTLEFDWCPMKQRSGKVDPVNLIVEVGNNQFEVPTHGWENDHKLDWIHATVDLSAVKFDETTRITIKQQEWGVKTANRWFLDNIRIYSAAE